MRVNRSGHAACAVLLGALLLAAAAPASAGEVSVGGWAGFAFADNDKDGTHPYFDAHPWYLYVKAQPVEGWRFFGELEAEHAFQFKAGKTGAGEFKLERLYVERNLSTKHNFRAGKTFMPFGYWYKLHWHFLTETLSRPVSFNNAYVPRQNVGLQYFGRTHKDDLSLAYNVWLGNGPDVKGTNKRTVATFGSGASAYLTQKLGGSYKKTLGFAGGIHNQKVALDEGTEGQTNFVGAVELRLGDLEARFEHYWHQRDVTGDLTSWYANGLYWFVPNVAVNLRYEQGDDLKRTGDDAMPEATVKSYALVFRPEAQVLIKAEYRQNEFENPDETEFNEWNVYLAIKY